MLFDLCALYTYTGPCCACVHLFSFVYCFIVRQLDVGNKIITQYIVFLIWCQLYTKTNHKLTSSKIKSTFV